MRKVRCIMIIISAVSLLQAQTSKKTAVTTAQTPTAKATPADPASVAATQTPTNSIPETSNFETFGYKDDDSSDEIPSEPSESDKGKDIVKENPPSSPQTYEIVRGDTLWDICKKILGDPWYWPKLWSLNEYIGNPHLIYPGNLIKFFPGSEVAPPQLTIEGATASNASEKEAPIQVAKQKEEVITQQQIKLDKSVSIAHGKTGILRLRPVTFVSKRIPEVLGKVSYSGTPKLELVLGDSVYLEFSKKMKVTVGDKFHVIENLQEVFDPDKKMHSYGSMIRKNAILQVKSITPTSIDARIIAGDRSIRRDDSFIAYQPEIKEITPFEAKKMITGKIIATENQQILISQNEFVYFNIGKSSGVTEGMRFYVVKKGDGVLNESADDEQLPYVVIGNCVIAEVFEGTATAYVSSLKETLEVGFQVRNIVN